MLSYIVELGGGCVARWWTGCVFGLAGLVPGALRPLPGHPQGGSVQPRSFPPACLQEMQDEGRALAGGRGVEAGTDRRPGEKREEGGHRDGVEVSRLFLEQQDEEMRCGPVRNARSVVLVVPVDVR